MPVDQLPTLTAVNVLIASSFVLVNALISIFFGLGIESKIIISAIRCVIQLTIMGKLLQPIFDDQDPYLIALMSILLLVIAVAELYYSRVMYRHELMLWSVLFSIGISVFTIAFLGNAFAINTDPWYKPTQYIPVLGMCIGNCMSAVAIGLNCVMNDILSNKGIIELHLAFGATRWECAKPICVRGIKLALLPILNSQSIMGLISIPGMMTGQILGGVPVQDAVNYQLIVTFMYTATSGLATVFTILGAVFSVFDNHARLRLEKISKKQKFSFSLQKFNSFIRYFRKRGDCESERPLLSP